MAVPYFSIHTDRNRAILLGADIREAEALTRIEEVVDVVLRVIVPPPA